MLTTFYREVLKMPQQEIERQKASLAWPSRLAAAHTMPRELRAEAAYDFEAVRFADLKVPTLLLLGSESPRYFETAAHAVHAALPNSRIIIMPGQQHVAMDAAPELFVHEVTSFLSES
jgi:pimeloyl-ACP methyl ester carboxylesterase